MEKNEVMDGSDIMKLVGNEAVFSNFVDHKFEELDIDQDGKLSVKELQPAVADIGVALGLPAQGSSPESDHIYSERNGKCKLGDGMGRIARCLVMGVVATQFIYSDVQTFLIQRGMLPLVNAPIVDYTLAWLESAGVEEVFDFCSAHSKQVIDYLDNSNWFGQPNFSVTTIESHNAISAGDALRSIYEQHVVLQEFTHGKQEKVSKTEFKEVLSDILLGMAAGLKRDPIVLLRMDGEDLLEFVKSPAFEPEILSIFSEIELPDGSLKDHIIKAFEKLTVDQGMPPASDSWVMSNVVEPVVESCIGASNEQPVSQETFLAEFKKVAESAAQRLKEQPVIVAHSENTFDGSGIRRLLSNKFELDKALDSAVKTVPKDRHWKMSKEYLRVALDLLAPSAGLPPIGAVDQMDKIIIEACKMLDADDKKMVKEEEFKKLLTEVLGSMMLQLEGNPVSVSTNSVVHEPLASASALLQPPSNSEM